MKKKTNAFAWTATVFSFMLFVLLGLGAALLGRTSLLARADSSESYQDEIDEAKKRKEELEKEKDELAAKLNELKKKKDDMNAYIESLDAQYLELLDSIDALEEEIADCEAELLKTQEELAAVKQQEAEQYETMKRRIRYMYENGETGFLDILLGDGTLADMFNEMEYRTEITKYDNELLERYNATKLQVEETEAMLTAQLEKFGALKDVRETELAALDELITVKTTELAELAASIGTDEEMLFTYWDEIVKEGANIQELEKKEAERIAEEERKRKEEEERLRREAEERARKEQELAEMKRNQDIENMLWPLPASGRVTSEFGYRGAPTAGASTYHRGIDIGAADLSGTERNVVAALAGTVIEASYNGTSGRYIKIDHGNGLVTAYLHADKLYVKVGDYVERGQVIMLAGNTGVSTGPHLHFGVFINGVAVDPLKYISYNK
ncbi:MAG: murein hydrolase activator EnvC family protein [Lachnospiraceae bacterium]